MFRGYAPTLGILLSDQPNIVCQETRAYLLHNNNKMEGDGGASTPHGLTAQPTSLPALCQLPSHTQLHSPQVKQPCFGPAWSGAGPGYSKNLCRSGHTTCTWQICLHDTLQDAGSTHAKHVPREHRLHEGTGAGGDGIVF